MQWVCIKHNGYKRIHGFKFESVAVKNGLIVSLHGSYESTRCWNAT